MKKFYLLALAACALSLSVNAQIIEDDFEFYALGDMGLQNTAVWSTWSGVPDSGENVIVVEAPDPVIDTQSGYIGPGGTQDEEGLSRAVERRGPDKGTLRPKVS